MPAVVPPPPWAATQVRFLLMNLTARLCKATPPAWRPGLCAAIGLAWCLVLAAGCGYRQDSPTLPGGARSLGIDVIHNQTFRGGVDVMLQKALRRLLLRNPALRLTSPVRGDLLLVVQLQDLTITRARSLTDTSISSLSYGLSGRMALYDNRDNAREVLSEDVSASAVLTFTRPVIETPSVQDEGLEDVIAAFAREVEARLYRSF